MHARTRPSLYEQLLALPEGPTGEILAGQLHAQPRPSGPHGLAGSVLGMHLGVPFQLGGGGPGGWWIIDEPELQLIPDTEVLVPDLAGWRRERMPRIPQGHRFTVVPDWVCEILSPASASLDRDVKLPIYSRHGVAFDWWSTPRRAPWRRIPWKTGRGWRSAALPTMTGSPPPRSTP